MFDGTSTDSLAFSVSAPMHSPNSGLTYTRIINMMSSQITVKGTITAVYMRIQHSISREEYGMATSSSVAARGSTATEITFDTPFSEPPCVFLQDRSGGGNVSDMINNKTIVGGVTLNGFTARSFNNTSTTFPDGMTFYWRAVGKQHSISQTLFKNEQGVKGAITLSDSAANYDYLEFFWKHDDGACGSQRIADPNGKTIGINATSSTSYGYLWFAYKGMNISGTQCTLNTDHAAGELGFTNDGTMERRKQDKLGITKVIGYKLS